MRQGHRQQRALQGGRHPVALIEQLRAVDRGGQGVRDALEEVRVVLVEGTRRPGRGVEDTDDAAADPDRDSDVGAPPAERGADDVVGGHVADDEWPARRRDPSGGPGTQGDRHRRALLLLDPDAPLEPQLPPVLRQQEERGAVAQDGVADDGEDPLDELVEAAGGVRGVADRLELPESVLRVFGRRPRATLVFVRPDAVQRDRRLMGDGQQETSFLRRNHVIAVEPEAQRSEDLRPERHRDAGEPAESGVAFDLPDDRESREELGPRLDEDRPAGPHDLGTGRRRVDRVSFPPVVGRLVQRGADQHLERPGVIGAADRESARIRSERLDRCGDGGPRDVFRRHRASEHLRHGSAAGGADCRRGVRARPRLRDPRSAWRSLPEMTPEPTAADEPEEHGELGPGLEVGDERHEDEAADQADQRTRERAAHDRRRDGDQRAEPARNAFEAPRAHPREEEEHGDLREDEARDPSRVPDPAGERPGRPGPSHPSLRPIVRSVPSASRAHVDLEPDLTSILRDHTPSIGEPVDEVETPP